MYRNFTYEVVGEQKKRLKATVKNCYFLTEFFKYFFRVLVVKIIPCISITPCIGSAISIETPPVGFFLKFSNV
jgi:hypothetical protein